MIRFIKFIIKKGSFHCEIKFIQTIKKISFYLIPNFV